MHSWSIRPPRPAAAILALAVALGCAPSEPDDAGGGAGGDLGPLVGGAGLCLPSGFCWENPLPQGNTLYAAWGTSASEVWAVGGRGDYVTRFDGSTWSAVALPAKVTLRAVHGRSADDVWAVGASGAGVHWNGTAWSSDPLTTASNVVYDVYVAPNGDAYAAMDYALRRRPAGGAWSTPTGVSASCRWTAVRGAGATLFAGGESECWGTSATGTAWTTTGPVLGAGSTPYDLWASPEGELWRSRGSAVQHSTDGATWTSRSAGLDETVRELTGTAAGEPWVVGSGAKAFRWNGSSWVAHATGLPAADANGLWVSGADGWIVGSWGRLARWNGTSFAEVSGGEREVELVALSAAGGDAAWAYVRETGACRQEQPASCEGRIWRRDASGWHEVWTRPGAPLYDGATLWAAAADDAWVTTPQLWRLTGTSRTVDPKFTAVTVIHGSGPADVWAYGVAAGAMQASLWQWNGSSWTERSPGAWEVTAIHAIAPDDVWVAGADHQLSHWNGSGWTPFTISAPNPWISGIWAAATDDVWFVGEAGKAFHWNGSAVETLSSGSSLGLYAVSGTAADDVWAVGVNGTVRRWNGSAWVDAVGGADRTLTAVAAAPGHVWIGGGNALLHKSW